MGDVVELLSGDKIPADGVFIEGTGACAHPGRSGFVAALTPWFSASDVECNESALTGEPEDQRKNSEKDPFLLSGCQARRRRFGAAATCNAGRSSPPPPPGDRWQLQDARRRGRSVLAVGPHQG